MHAALLIAAALSCWGPGSVNSVQDARADLKNGRAALRRGDYPLARQLLKAVAETRPDDWDVRARLVEAQTSCGKRADAEAVSREFLSRHAGHPGAAASLSAIKLDQGDAAAALEAADAGLGADPKDPRALLAKAEALAALGRREEAVAALEGFEETYRKSGDEFFKDRLVALARGLALLDELAARPAAGKLSFEKILPEVLRADNDPGIRALAGFCHLARHRTDEAARCFVEALKVNPNLARAHLGLGQVALEQGNADGARQAAERALGIDGELVQAHALKARALLWKQDAGGAAEALQSAPGHPRLDALREAAAAMSGEGKADGPAANYELGRALAAARRFREAADCLDRGGDAGDAKILAELNRFRAEGKEIGRRGEAETSDALALELSKLSEKFAADYATFVVEGFEVRVPGTARAWLEPWVREVLIGLAATFREGLVGAPSPIVIFCRPEEIALLARGVPGGGGCLGRIVAVPMPRADFSWASALSATVAQSVAVRRTGSRVLPAWLFDGIGAFFGREAMDRSYFLSLKIGRRDGTIKGLADVPVEAVDYLFSGRGLAGFDKVETENESFLAWLDKRLAECRYVLPPRSADGDPKNAALDALARNEIDLALKHARQAVEADPKSAPAHSLLGQALRRNHQDDEACEHLRKAVDLGADDYRTWYVLGDTLEDLEDTKGAVEAFEKAMKAFPGLIADPAGPNVYRRLMRLHRRAGAAEEEMKVLTDAVPFEPTNLRDLWRVARHYAEKDDAANAAVFLRRIARVQPADRELCAAMARALAARKDFAGAVGQRLAAVSLIEAGQTRDEAKDKGEEYCEIAGLYLEMGRKDKAAEFAMEALRRIPEHERARRIYEEASR